MSQAFSKTDNDENMEQKEDPVLGALVERMDNVLLRLQVVCLRLGIVENMLDVFEGVKPRQDAVEDEVIVELENMQVAG